MFGYRNVIEDGGEGAKGREGFEVEPLNDINCAQYSL